MKYLFPTFCQNPDMNIIKLSNFLKFIAVLNEVLENLKLEATEIPLTVQKEYGIDFHKVSLTKVSFYEGSNSSRIFLII